MKNAQNPGSLFSPHIELFGNRQAMLEGCRGVLYYNDDRIEISLGKYRILFLGKDLGLTSLAGGDAIVTGTFETIEFLL